jgi:predicted dinucleotide-binding enzyme
MAIERIAVIGTGNIGGTLGRRWSEAGYRVAFGARAPRADGPGGAPVVSIDEAVTDADVVLLAVPAGAVAGLVAHLGPTLADTVVIDATNNLRGASANARSEFTPDTRYVRAFNTLGWENFDDPVPESDLFFAADPRARAVAEELISALGLRPQYVGGAGAADVVDGLLRLWFALVGENGGNRRLALKLVM